MMVGSATAFFEKNSIRSTEAKHRPQQINPCNDPTNPRHWASPFHKTSFLNFKVHPSKCIESVAWARHAWYDIPNISSNVILSNHSSLIFATRGPHSWWIENCAIIDHPNVYICGIRSDSRFSACRQPVSYDDLGSFSATRSPPNLFGTYRVKISVTLCLDF